MHFSNITSEYCIDICIWSFHAQNEAVVYVAISGILEICRVGKEEETPLPKKTKKNTHTKKHSIHIFALKVIFIHITCLQLVDYLVLHGAVLQTGLLLLSVLSHPTGEQLTNPKI